MGSLVSKPKAPPMPKPIKLPEYTPPPAPEPVPVMPTPDDEAIMRKKRKEMAAQAAKSGRASTFLSDDEGTLG